jgi:hypothetical protein
MNQEEVKHRGEYQRRVWVFVDAAAAFTKNTTAQSFSGRRAAARLYTESSSRLAKGAKHNGGGYAPVKQPTPKMMA